MKNIEVLIVTRSVVLQQGLGALLESLPEISSAKIIQELTNAYVWIEGHQPGIIFIDSDVIGNDPGIALGKILIFSPKAKRVLLVNDVKKQSLMQKYVEAVLIKGAAPSSVAAIVANLLADKGDNQKDSDAN